MLGNFDIHLRANGTHVIRRFMGHQVRAAFLDLITKYDDELAEKLHEEHQSRTYAIGYPSLENNYWPNKDHITLRKGEKLIIRVKTLTKEITGDFVKAWINKSSEDIITLYNREFVVESIEMKTMSREDFNKELQKPITHAWIEFITPTQFSKKELKSPWFYPDPVTVMLSVANLWNTIYPETKIDVIKYKNYLEKNTVLKKIEYLFTDNIRAGKIAYQTGIVGKVLWDFETNGNDAISVFNHWSNGLLTFAKYSNVGKSRTAGMGVIRVIKPKNKENKEKVIVSEKEN